VAFAIGGVSGVVLKIVALAVWLGMALLAARIMREWIGSRAAGYGVALILWAPTSVEWAMKARGGYMLSVIFSLLTMASALRSRKTSNALAIGAFGAAAVWAQPTSIPVVGMIVMWVVVGSLRKRDFLVPAVVVAGAAMVSIIPVLALSTSEGSWSWQAFAGAETHRDPALLFESVLPAFFTPELDGAYPPMPLWIRTIGYLWLVTVIGACALGVKEKLRGGLPDHLQRPAALLLAAVAVAPLAFFMVGSYYARPRHILMFYPLACIIVAAATEWWRAKTARPWPLVIPLVLLSSGAAVHLHSFGPPTIHGAGEQEWRQPAALLADMIADLDRHDVRCVFSESPMLQWNLMFASNERIAARWTTAEDRWPPYVERVNRAFAAGDRCAVLIFNAPGSDRITALRTHVGEESVTVFNERYALLYQVPSNITQVFR
jgi:hypothetical protein